MHTPEQRPPLPSAPPINFWRPVALAGFILMITMGIRQTVGLFVHPIVSTTAIDIAGMSMALAIGQLVWGLFQPVFGAWADKNGPFPVLVTGAVLMACGQLFTVWAASFLPLTITLGMLSPAGAAAGSFSLLFGIISAQLSPDKRSVASGVVNAGGSLGQFVFSPIVQLLISLKGYAGGLFFLASASLLTIIPAWFLCRPKQPAVFQTPASAPASAGMGIRKQVASALHDPSYLLLHAGFFTCGFHVAFLTTHLPGEVSLCGHTAAVSAASLSLIGLCNIAGSIMAGILGKYYRMKFILSALYAFRAIMIAAYLFSPKTELTFYIFAITTGFTWLATVPPTAGIVGKLFGTRYLATLFGLTLLTHQVGGFLGAWLGGLAIQNTGNLLWVWYIDIALAAMAAVVNLPIREERVAR